MALVYQGNIYNSELLDFITEALIERINLMKTSSQCRDQLNAATMHSFFKNYKELRYENKKLYERLTDELI